MRSRQNLLLLLVAALCACSSSNGSGTPAEGRVVMLPEPGLPRYQELGAIPVPGGVVSPAGGNYMHRRIDFSIDTLLGTREVGAVYNTADDVWRWSWELELAYDGFQIIDATAAVHRIIFDFGGEVRLFPGGHWVRIDANHMRSVGGLVHEFYDNGKLKAIYWQSADYPRLAYRTSQPFGAGNHDRVEQCTSPTECELVYAIERDFAARVTALEDRAGRRAEFTYDAAGKPHTARDPLDVVEGWSGRRYEWWGPRLLAITNSEGERIEIQSGWSTGQVTLVRQVGAPSRNHRFTYGRTQGARPLNEASREIRYRDPEGHVTTIFVDGYRRARSVQRPSGATTSYTYTASSFELESIERPDGSRIEYAFESETRIIRTEASGNRTRFDVRLDSGENRQDPFQRPIDKIEDDLGLVEERAYDSQGRLTWIENGERERASFSYDADNQLASITPPNGVITQLSDYGAHGKAETINSAGETQTRTFDAVGNLVAESGFDVMDARVGGVAARDYDADRNVATVWLAESDPSAPLPVEQAISLAYRSDQQPTAIRRPGGGDHEFFYNPAGQQVERREKVDGVWQATLFEVDRRGFVTAEILPNGMRRERSFDSDGNLAGVRSLQSAAVETEASLTWTNGQLAEIDDAAYAAAETYTYDAAGRLTTTLFPDGESLTHEYDLRDRRIREDYLLSGGSTLRTLHYGFDLAGRPTSLRDGAADLLTIGFSSGRVRDIAYGNGLTETFGYDTITGRQDSRALANSGGVIAFSSTSRVLSPPNEAVQVSAATTSPLDDTFESYDLGFDAATSDAGKRVISSNSEALAYDALSNLTRIDSRALGYNAEKNRIVSVATASSGTVDYGTDAAGYVTMRGAVALSWTAEGLIADIGADAFEYDALGRAVFRRLSGVEAAFSFGGRVETDAQATPLRIDLRPVVLELSTGETRFRHADYRGNIDLITNSAGSVVAHYGYTAYGVESITGTDDGAVTFAQGRLVQGLVIVGGRVLDPEAARFLAPDPEFQTESQFAYTTGNPIDWWDPTGLRQSNSPAAVAADAQLVAGTAEVSVAILLFAIALAPATAAATTAVLIGAGVILLSDGVSAIREGIVNSIQEDAKAGGQLGAGVGGSETSPGVGGVQGLGVVGSALPAGMSRPPTVGGPDTFSGIPNGVSSYGGGGGFGGFGGGF